MKRWILGLALLGIATVAFGSGWIKVASSPHGTETMWVMHAQVPGEIWEKANYDSPQQLQGAASYNKIISLNRVDCANSYITALQFSYYLDARSIETIPGDGTPYYGIPGTFGAAIMDVACGTK
jgi:hypothetical protein